jgi:ribonucleotide monophosphatase NagD (HAD superfamily)
MNKIEKKENYKVMENFGLKNIPSLDVCVLGALELLSSKKIPKINMQFKRPLVAGSGNAEATGRIIFRNIDAVFASESDYENKLRHIKNIDGVVVVSASGEKHAPIIAKTSKKYKKKVILITNNENADAKRYSNETFVLPKQKEPYTYNTSTYMGMILGFTKENPSKIYDYIKDKIEKINFKKLKNFEKFYVVVPTEFSEIKRMVQVKFIELFGRKVARDVETSEYVKHATTVVPSKELFIVFHNSEKKAKKYSDNQINIPLPKNSKYGSMMAISYYVMGKIQNSREQWFKKNISNYTKKASKIFGQDIEPIVK